MIAVAPSISAHFTGLPHYYKCGVLHFGRSSVTASIFLIRMYTMVLIYEEAPTRIRPAITSKTARLSLKVLAVSGFSLPVRHPKMEGYIVYLQEGLGEITQSAVDEQLSKIKKKLWL